MKKIIWSLIITNLITGILVWYITKMNVKPEVVVQRQNVYIERLKTENKVLTTENKVLTTDNKEKDKEIFWVRLRSFFAGVGTYAIYTVLL